MSNEDVGDELTPEVAEQLRVYLEKLAADICPFCDTPITDQRQVGRCVYALPCNCRLYQGTVAARFAKPKKIHPYLQEQLDMEN
jgi:hypothetical protein